MKRAIDAGRGCALYARRFATVEPVSPSSGTGLDHFTACGRKKGDAQWKLFYLVHKIEKLAHHGYGQ